MKNLFFNTNGVKSFIIGSVAPGNGSQNEKESRAEIIDRRTADGNMGENCSGHQKKETGIRPFFNQREFRKKNCNYAQHFPCADDGEKICRISQRRHSLHLLFHVNDLHDAGGDHAQRKPERRDPINNLIFLFHDIPLKM